MRNRLLILIAALMVFGGSGLTAAPKPKLVVVIVIDQFRYDYLTRFRAEYKGGLAKLLDGGAVFTNANYLQSPTVTAIGHSIIMTGAMPSVSGIVGNEWFERESGRIVKSVCDQKETLLGIERMPPGVERKAPLPRKCEDSDPASPRRLLVSTVGDELRNREKDARVIGISFKARSAILPAGHRATGAFWFDDISGGFVSSSYYFDKLPPWVEAFNAIPHADGKFDCPWAAKPCRNIDGYITKKWETFTKDRELGPWNFRGGDAKPPYERLAASPWGNELIEGLAERAIEGEQLGQRGATDLLTVSFSSNDYVGHLTGPDSDEVHDMCLRTDDLVGKLMQAIEKKVPPADTLYVLTADHGVSPMPAKQKDRKMPGGYLYADPADSVRLALNKQFGEREWILPSADTFSVDTPLYLNWDAAPKPVAAGVKAPSNDEKKVSHTEILRVAVDALLRDAGKYPGARYARVYTRDQLIAGVSSDAIGRAASYGFQPERSGDIVIIQEPYWVTAGKNKDKVPLNYDPEGTTHSTPYRYDTHVPVIFYGAGTRAGVHPEDIAINDIAPTLAAILGVEPPSGSSGRVLTQVLAPR